MQKDTGYIGKIQNSGAQKVKAPIPMTTKKNGVVKKGEDLRNGK